MKETRKSIDGINESDNKIKTMFGIDVGIKTNLEYSESGYLKIKEWVIRLWGAEGKGLTFVIAMSNLEYNISSENLGFNILEKHAVPKIENEE